MLLDVKPNEVKAHFKSYIHYWRGTPKVGKTTMFRDVMIEEFGDSKYGLLLSLGKEKGHEAISGIYAKHVPTWKDLRTVILELVKNKEEYDFEVIGFDTVDELVLMAEEEVIDEDWRNVKKGRGNKATLNSALGGYGAGHRRKKELLSGVIRSIRDAGYGIVFIGHTKEKLMTEKGVDQQYYRLVSNLSHGDDEVFGNLSDIIATFHTVRASDNENRVSNTMRYIFFRDDNFVDAGSRFAGMPAKVPFGDNGANAYLKGMREGIRNSALNASEEELSARAQKEEAQRKSEYKERSDTKTKELEKEVLTSLQEEAVALAKSAGGSQDETIMAILKKYHPDGRIDIVKDEEKLKTAIEELKKYIEEKE